MTWLRREFIIVLLLTCGLLTYTYLELPPLRAVMNWRATQNANSEREVTFADYEVYDHTAGDAPWITVDFVKGKQFWNPQIAIWLEDSTGAYIETLLVTTATAEGLFYAGRTASNFKESDQSKTDEHAPTRRVDALPYWSHKRGHRYADGFYSPPPGQPAFDGVTGATPVGNFYLQSIPNRKDLSAFRILVEVNVAFDDNEFYSEYDFLDDSLYHNGTGLLGQPSIIYGAVLRKEDTANYYVMTALGHGHHSGSTGDLFADLTTLTTARKIVERIVVGVNEEWYDLKPTY